MFNRPATHLYNSQESNSWTTQRPEKETTGYTSRKRKKPQYIVTFYNRKLFMHAQIILFLRKKDFVPWINNYRFRNHYIMFRFSTCLIMWGCLCHVTFEQLKLKQVQEKSGLEFLFYLRKEKKMKKKKSATLFYMKRLQNCHRTHEKYQTFS